MALNPPEKRRREGEDAVNELDIPGEKKGRKNPYDVIPCKSEKSELPCTPFMKNGVIAKFPSMWLVVGRSGSGKSTVVQFVVTDPNFMGDFFDEIKMFSPTANVDDIAEQLFLNDDDIYLNPSEDDLNRILDNQQEIIKKIGITAAAKKHKLLCIFDDIVASQEFLTSSAFLRFATMGRHNLAGGIVCTQSYTKIPRIVRLQARAVILFPSNQDEVQLIVQDFCPPHMHKRDFTELVESATTEEHDFLHINMTAKPSHRFRRCFGTYLIPSEPERTTTNRTPKTKDTNVDRVARTRKRECTKCGGELFRNKCKKCKSKSATGSEEINQKTEAEEGDRTSTRGHG